MLFRAGFVGRQFPVGAAQSVIPSLDLDFTTGVLDPRITWTRNSTATDGLYTDFAGSSYNTYGVNIPRMTPRGLLIENAAGNFLLNSDAPVTQTTGSLGAATYTLWCIGTGSVTSSAGTAVGTGFGVATPGTVNTFVITTPGTVVITVSGALNRFQLENRLVPTSYIPTGGTTVTRQPDTGVLPLGSWYNPVEGTTIVDFTRSFSTGGSFNDIPCLWADAGNMIGARIPGTTAIQSVVWSGNVNTILASSFPMSMNSVNRQATAYHIPSLTLRSSLNGSASTVNTGSSMPTPTQIHFGVTRSFALDDFVTRLRYWNRAMNTNELPYFTNTANDMQVFNFMTPGVLDRRITFTRASNATYVDSGGVLRTATFNQPRWQYEQGVLSGMLVEEVRTNLVTNSSPLTDFTAANSTKTAGATAAPDGSTTGVQLTEDTTSGVEHTGIFAFTPTASAVYTASVYAKANTRTRVVIEGRVGGNWVGGNAVAVANLTAGTIAVFGGTATAAIQNIGSGWYRISITMTAVAAPVGTSQIWFGLADNTGNPVYTGDGVSSAYFWGAQLEVGPMQSSYITSGASATARQGDVADAPLGSWFNTAAFTMYADFLTSSYATAGGGVLRVDDGTAPNSANIILNNVAPYAVTVSSVSGGTVEFSPPWVNLAFGVPHKTALSVDANGALYAADGTVAVASGIPAPMPIGLNRMRFGNIGTGVVRCVNGALRRVRTLGRTSTIAELQQGTQ